MWNKMDEYELYREALRLWGAHAQIDMMIEEASELIQALQKLKRSAAIEVDANSEHVCEEVADTMIMLRQMSLVFNSKIIERYILVKLDRLYWLIKAEKKKHGDHPDSSIITGC